LAGPDKTQAQHTIALLGLSAPRQAPALLADRIRARVSNRSVIRVWKARVRTRVVASGADPQHHWIG
jgi:hypothetical protein